MHNMHTCYCLGEGWLASQDWLCSMGWVCLIVGELIRALSNIVRVIESQENWWQIYDAHSQGQTHTQF